MKRAAIVFSVLFSLAAAGGDAETEYARRAAAAKSADDHFQLALWCADRGLPAYALRHHRAVVTLAPDHLASRRALGFEKVAGRWVRGDEAMRAKGFVEHEGRWITPEEHALYAKDAIAAQRARDARAKADEALKLARHEDPGVRKRAMKAILALEPEHRLRPLSIASRVVHRDVRLEAIDGLRALNTADALPPLYKRAIFDAEEVVRKAAVEAIGATDAEGKIGPFVGALDSPFPEVRVAAIQALGALGDAGAVGPLVARYRVAGGSGQSVYISQVNQISFVQDFDVEVAQTSFIADPVIGVIQDGLTLNFRALATTGEITIYERPALSAALANLTGEDLGDDPQAWARWYREEQRRLRAERAQRVRESAEEADGSS